MYIGGKPPTMTVAKETAKYLDCILIREAELCRQVQDLVLASPNNSTKTPTLGPGANAIGEGGDHGVVETRYIYSCRHTFTPLTHFDPISDTEFSSKHPVHRL